jgi:hypothetical protein
VRKVRAAEDAWNSCNPERVSLAYTPDCYWRNRSEFICGGAEIVAFLKRKWTKELDYRLIKELWAFTESRIGLAKRPPAGQFSKGAKRKAAKMAGREIDRLGDQTATSEERARRKRRLIKGPREFRDIRKNKS